MRNRRLLALLLAALLLATSCATTGETNETTADTSVPDETTETVESETQIADSLPDMDLAGYTYRMSINGNDERRAQTFVEELIGETINDAVYNQRITVEERFNAKIVMAELIDTADSLTSHKNSIVAGDDAFDLLQGHDISMAQMSLEGLFYDLYTLPYLDFTKPWWPAATTESMTVAGQMYMMFNNISCHNLSATRVMFFNKDMMKSLGLEYPYDMVYEGTWTMDTMLTMVDAAYVDTNGNGEKDIDDQVGFISPNNFYAVMEPFQVEPYQRDEEGKLYYKFDLEKMMKLTEKYYALLFGKGGFMKQNVDNDIYNMFTEGKGLFMYTGFSNAITQFSYGDVVFGLLPMPKLDEEQDGYYGGATDRPLAIPITASSHLDETSLLTEALNVEGYRQVFPAYYETAMKTRYADQTDDAVMMELIHDNVIISFTYLFGNYQSAYNIMFEDLFAKSSTPGTDVASWAAKKEKSQTEHVAKLQKFFDENVK